MCGKAFGNYLVGSEAENDGFRILVYEAIVIINNFYDPRIEIFLGPHIFAFSDFLILGFCFLLVLTDIDSRLTRKRSSLQ